jgi:hypothetical protein
MTKDSPFSHLGGPPAPTREQLAAEARAHALSDALADAAVERQRLESELAASQASEKRAEREARSLRRELASAESARSEARSESRSKEIFEETVAGLSAARSTVPSFDTILETLRGSPDACALAKMVVDAGRVRRGEVDPGFVFSEGATAEQKRFAIAVTNAGRKARNLPPLAESDEPGKSKPDPDELKPRPGKSPGDDADDDSEIDEDGKLKKAKKKKLPKAGDEEDEAKTKAPDALADPQGFAAAVHAAAKKARGR